MVVTQIYENKCSTPLKCKKPIFSDWLFNGSGDRNTSFLSVGLRKGRLNK